MFKATKFQFLIALKLYDPISYHFMMKIRTGMLCSRNVVILCIIWVQEFKGKKLVHRIFSIIIYFYQNPSSKFFKYLIYQIFNEQI